MKRELAHSEQIKEENDRKRKIFVKRQWARLQRIKNLIDQLVTLIDSKHIKVRVDKYEDIVHAGQLGGFVAD